jgi:hypothetical protein
MITGRYQRWRHTVRRYECPTCHAPPNQACEMHTADIEWLRRDYHLSRHTIARRDRMKLKVL